MLSSHFTAATTEYWQEILSSNHSPPSAPWKYAYPALLPKGKTLYLPIRETAKPSEAVASFLVTHAAIDVADELGECLADKILEAGFTPDVIVGLPTLGLSVARTVAKKLGHKRFVSLGYSRKFWYDEKLSTEVHSITSPNHPKKIFLDPNNVSLLAGKQIFIVDDAISSGTTMRKCWDLLESKDVGAEVLGAGVVMKQGEHWMGLFDSDIRDNVVWVFSSPLLRKVKDGWVERLDPRDYP